MTGDRAHGFRYALRQPGAVTFTSAGLLARLPVAMIALATVLLVSNVSGSYGYAGLLSALFAVTAALVSIVTSRWADSVGQTIVLRVLGVLHSGLIVAFTASIVAEIVRGSIQSLPRGQVEAAISLGLNPFQRLRLVILPQAQRGPSGYRLRAGQPHPLCHRTRVRVPSLEFSALPVFGPSSSPASALEFSSAHWTSGS